jgi:hypothetical protein
VPGVIAIAMLNAVGLCLAGLGTLGALLAAWQLAGWALLGGPPGVAEVWRHSGLAGDLLVRFFDALPAVLTGAIVFHVFVACLGVGLYRRRRWAWPAGLGLAALWAATAVLSWRLIARALDDLARGFPDRALFAYAAERLATGVAAVSIGLGVVLAWLLLQPAVRVEFRTGS